MAFTAQPRPATGVTQVTQTMQTSRLGAGLPKPATHPVVWMSLVFIGVLAFASLVISVLKAPSAPAVVLPAAPPPDAAAGLTVSSDPELHPDAKFQMLERKLLEQQAEMQRMSQLIATLRSEVYSAQASITALGERGREDLPVNLVTPGFQQPLPDQQP